MGSASTWRVYQHLAEQDLLSLRTSYTNALTTAVATGRNQVLVSGGSAMGNSVTRNLISVDQVRAELRAVQTALFKLFPASGYPNPSAYFERVTQPDWSQGAI